MSLPDPGTVLLDKYRIEHVVAKGGMGVVARAHHLHLDVPVAVKFLLPEVLEQPEVLKRFLREAQAAVKLKSEHVCRVIDVGTLETGAPYMVMEYLEGTDLRDLLRDHGRLEPGFAVDLVLQACEGLAEAHAVGIVHRDIKPSNLFLAKGTGGAPLVKLLDFGVSKAPISVDEGITRSHVLVGTPPYMSPEQLKSSKDVDFRTDIWAVGAALYELLSGGRPFRAESFPGLVLMISTQPMHPLRDVTLPAGLADVIARCLEKNPDRRFQSMAELVKALAPYAGTPIQAVRSIERTARALSQGTAPVTSRVVRADTDVPLTSSGSTMRESAGEHVPVPAARPTLPMRRKVPFAAPPETIAPPPAALDPPRRRRGPIIAMAAVSSIGLVVALVVLPRRTPDPAELRPFSDGVETGAGNGAAGASPAALPDPVALDAGTASNVASDEERGSVDGPASATELPASTDGINAVPAATEPSSAPEDRTASQERRERRDSGKRTRTKRQAEETTRDEPPDDNDI
ncbi:MAG TPA: serine/threonine-protein kinase, partial [Haliangium sp.]|nr:serine/threonine-protein kinase [Haliangium sp.]